MPNVDNKIKNSIMHENIFRVTFSHYFWTSIPFIVLLIIALMEGCIASWLLKNKTFNRQIIIVIIISNAIGYFSEYFLSVLINGGHILLVWIPWVKIIGTIDLIDYILSFPFIYLVTVLVEGSVNWLLLKHNFANKKILKTTIQINLVSFLILVIIFNCVVFNIIKGEEFGNPISPSLPELPASSYLKSLR